MMEQGDKVRIRREGSNDQWCVCVIELLSPNKLSAGLRVLDGALHTHDGGMLTGFIPVSFTHDMARDIVTGTELEMDLWKPN